MKHYIARVEINWADEINFSFMSVVDEDTKCYFHELINRWQKEAPDEELYVGFGSNESGEYSVDDIDEAVDFQEITEEDYKTLERLHLTQVGSDRLGWMMDDIEEMLESTEDDEDDDEEEDDEDDEAYEDYNEGYIEEYDDWDDEDD